MPANAFLLTYFWRYCDRLTPAILISAYLGSVLAEYAQNKDLQMALFWPLINIIEVTLGFLLMKKFIIESGKKSKFETISAFLLLVSGLSSCLATLLVAIYFSLNFGNPFLHSWVTGFMTDTLGFMVITPMIMFFDWKEIVYGYDKKEHIKTIIAWTLFISIIATAYFHTGFPAFYFAIPAIITLSFFCGFSSAVSGIFFIGIDAFISSVSGYGSLSSILGENADQVLYLQVFLATIVLTTLPISARLSDERKAHKLALESKETAETLHAAADTANKAKSEFLTSISHELRTPLNAISGFAQLLQMREGRWDDKQNDYVDSILEGSGHLIKMVDDILDLAKIENQKIELQPELVQVNDSLEKAVRLMKPIADNHNIALHLSNNCSTYYLGDPSRVLQVLINLISNAIKYNKENGRVDVCCECDGPFIKFLVEDTGPGIDPVYQDDLFEAFNRGSMQQGKISGAGVGLAICKKLIEAMGGEIGYESNPGEGTTFWFTMPNYSESEFITTPCKKYIPQREVSQAGNGNHIPVLYVEDNVWNAKLLPDVLSPIEDIEVFIAENGKLGLDLAKKINPSLIILDIHLPDMDGHDLAEKIREIDELKNVPIFALTSDATDLARSRGMDAKFDHWITKPFNVHQMQKLVKQTLLAA